MIRAILASVFIAILAIVGVEGAKRGGGVQSTGMGMTTSSNSTSTTMPSVTGASGAASI